MATKAKIFVSHSAKSDAHKNVLTEFVQKLQDEGLDPWVDYERIKTGSKWNPAITQGLHQCHGAVVLFSRQALNSDFVKYEVSCLAYRKRTQPGFGLYPLILDNLKVETVTQRFFGSIQFGEFQIGRLAEKCDEVIGSLKSLDPQITTPTSAMEDVLLTIFRNIAPTALRQTATMNELGWPTWPNVDIPDAEALHFVRCLLAESLEHQILALNSIKGALPAEWNIGKVFDFIAPFWVDEDAALRLQHVQASQPGHRCAIVNGSHANFTCEAYLKRARPLKDAAILNLTGEQANGDARSDSLLGGVVSAGRRAHDDLVHQIRRTLCHRYNIETREKTEQDIDDDLDLEIEFDEKAGRSPVEAIQLSATELPVLVDLASSFRRVTFVAMTGQTLPQIDASVSQCASVIEPELKYEAQWQRHNENYAYRYWSRRKRLLGLSND